MQCRELMKTETQTLRPDDSAQTAARTMRDKGIGFIPVCDDEGAVVGTVTDRDLAIRVMADALPPNLPLGNFMTRNLVYCRPEDDVRQAELRMGEAKVSRILCIDESSDRLAGVISLSDIAQLESGGRAMRTLQEVSSREARP